MAISFPYPVMGTTRRRPGEGCVSCVHRAYCQAFYWLYRNSDTPSFTGKTGNEVDPHLGTMCQSWNDNESQRITTPNSDDLAFNKYYGETDPILRESFDSGISEMVTGNDRDK